MKISAVIIACNEEQKIAKALDSVDWADEIVVVDSGSTDRTCEIATEHGARVIVESWRGFARQKQFATECAENDWILSLDADETVSPALRDEIIAMSDASPVHAGYRIPRLSFYLGRPIRHAGWYPDWQLRLFDRTRGRWKDVLVHESVSLDEGSSVGKLSGDIHHYSVENASHHHRMIGERYAPLAAEQMFKSGRRASYLSLATAAPSAFVQSYLLKLGFLDGIPGLSIASFAAHHAFLKHLMLWEMQSAEK